MNSSVDECAPSGRQIKGINDHSGGNSMLESVISACCVFGDPVAFIGDLLSDPGNGG